MANPTIIATVENGADGSWPVEHEMRALQTALDFAVLDGNPPWSEENRIIAGRSTATSDNSQIHFWPVDVDNGRISQSSGHMVRNAIGGYTIEAGFTVRSPVELHIPNDLTVEEGLLSAALSIFMGEHDSQNEPLARRLPIAATWLSQAWRNTESIRDEERIIMLKTGFEALTDVSVSWESAQRLEALFRTLPLTERNDFMAQYLVWKPSETSSMEYASRWGEILSCTPLQHWFMSFADCRNEIIHQGRAASNVYAIPRIPVCWPLSVHWRTHPARRLPGSDG